MTDVKTVTVQLDAPVTVGEKTYASLTFRKMKAKDLVAQDLVKGEQRQSMALFASMAGVPIGVIEELDVDDYEKLALEVAPLLGKSAMAAMAAVKAAQTAAAETLSTPSPS